jgi:hypothetical protein
MTKNNTKLKKNLLSNNKEKECTVKKLRSASGLLFRSTLHPPYSLFPSLLKKKKGKRSITVYSPYYLIFALFPILPSTLPSQQSKIRGGGMHTLSKKKNREDLKIYSI